MKEPSEVRWRYRQFADRECRGYSELYYDLAVAVSEDAEVNERRFLLGRTQFTNGRRQDELLALAHPHGADLTWL